MKELWTPVSEKMNNERRVTARKEMGRRYKGNALYALREMRGEKQRANIYAIITTTKKKQPVCMFNY